MTQGEQLNSRIGNALEYILAHAERFCYWPAPGVPVRAIIGGKLVEFSFTDQGRKLAQLAQAQGWTWMPGDLWLQRPPDRVSQGYVGGVHAGMAPCTVRVEGGEPSTDCPF